MRSQRRAARRRARARGARPLRARPGGCRRASASGSARPIRSRRRSSRRSRATSRSRSHAARRAASRTARWTTRASQRVARRVARAARAAHRDRRRRGARRGAGVVGRSWSAYAKRFWSIGVELLGRGEELLEVLREVAQRLDGAGEVDGEPADGLAQRRAVRRDRARRPAGTRLFTTTQSGADLRPQRAHHRGQESHHASAPGVTAPDLRLERAFGSHQRGDPVVRRVAIELVERVSHSVGVSRESSHRVGVRVALGHGFEELLEPEHLRGERHVRVEPPLEARTAASLAKGGGGSVEGAPAPDASVSTRSRRVWEAFLGGAAGGFDVAHALALRFTIASCPRPPR